MLTSDLATYPWAYTRGRLLAVWIPAGNSSIRLIILHLRLRTPQSKILLTLWRSLSKILARHEPMLLDRTRVECRSLLTSELGLVNLQRQERG